MEPSVYLVEYGHVDDHPVAGFVAGGTGKRGTPFGFAVVVDGTGATLIDAGFSAPYHQQRLGAKYGGGRWIAPAAALARLGVPADAVRLIVLTHKHFDHAGAIGDFPGAEVIIQRAEIEQHEQALREPGQRAAELRATDPDILDTLRRSRLRQLDGPAVLLPDAGPLRVFPAPGTHTLGSQYAVLSAEDGPLVFAGDNVSAYENVEGAEPVPVGSLNGPAATWMSLARELIAAAGGNTTRIIPFHDDAVWARYPAVTFPDGLRVAALTPSTALPTTEG